jgi:large subunit ribosomal protein L25
VAEVRISAETRTEFGKGGARRTRRAGKVPAVLYGHGSDTRHISLPARELSHALRTDAGFNVLLELDLGSGTELALPKNLQRHPIRGSVEHIDLVLVRRGEKVTVDIPLTLTGHAGPDGMVDQQHMTLSIEAEATHLPQFLEVSIDGLQVGDSITAGQVSLPSGSVLHGDPSAVVVQVLGAPTAEEIDAELEGAEAELGAGAAGAAEQEAAKAEVGDGVTDGATGTGDVVGDTDSGEGGPAAPDES